MLWYFLSEQNREKNKRKNKTEKQRGFSPGRPTYLAQPSHKPAQPTRGRVVFYPRPGRQLVGVAGMPATAPPPGRFPGHLAPPRGRLEGPGSSPSPCAICLFSPRQIVHAPEAPSR